MKLLCRMKEDILSSMPGQTGSTPGCPQQTRKYSHPIYRHTFRTKETNIKVCRFRNVLNNTAYTVKKRPIDMHLRPTSGTFT